MLPCEVLNGHSSRRCHLDYVTLLYTDAAGCRDSDRVGDVGQLGIRKRFGPDGLGSPYGQLAHDAVLLNEMKTLDQITSVLSRKKPLLAQAGIKEIGVFGSYVRGEQRDGSDLDVLIDIERPAKMDLLKLIDLEQELSTDLGVPVDLVLKSTLRPSLGKEILSEVVYL